MQRRIAVLSQEKPDILLKKKTSTSTAVTKNEDRAGGRKGVDVGRKGVDWGRKGVDGGRVSPIQERLIASLAWESYSHNHRMRT